MDRRLKRFTNNTQARVAPYTITVMLIITALSGFLVVTHTVKADTVTSITEDAGVCTTVISFNYSDNVTNFRIYFDEVTGIDTGTTNYTYDDPDHRSSNQNSNHRRIIIMGLVEDTKYYYKVYDVTHSSWATTDEHNFTTLPRFTNETGWQDEFFDEYLISKIVNADLIQQVATKHPSNPLVNTTADGYGMCCPSFYYNETSDEYYGWFYNTSAVAMNRFATSPDGVDWTLKNGVTCTGAGCVYGKYFYRNGTWHCFNDEGPTAHESYYTSTSANGTYTFIAEIANKNWQYSVGETMFNGVGDDTYAPECISHIAYGQQYVNVGGAPARGQGRWFGFNYTDWIGFDWDNTSTNTSPRDKTPNFPNASGVNCVYSAQTFCRSGVYVGLNVGFKGDIGNQIRCYLMTSRDQWNWTNFDPDNVLLYNGTSGSWDGGTIRGVWNTPEWDWVKTINGEEWAYYTGTIGDHDDDSHTCIGLMKWRLKGLTAVEPSSPNAHITTISIPRYFTNNFTVNANCTATAKLNISILNANTNTPYSGFSFDDFDTITTNSTSISPTWGDVNLSSIPNGNFKINFSLDSDGKLFSYTLDGYGEAPNIPPEITVLYPDNESTGISFDPVIACSISDINSDTLSGNLRTNASGAWEDIGSFGPVGNCSVNCNTGVFDIFQTLSTKYWWSMNLSDGTDWTNETFTFTTRGNALPVISDISPANKTTGWSVSGTTLTFTLTDINEDYIPFNTTTNISATFNQSSLWITNGTYYLELSTLEPNTNYTWWINVTDYHHPASTGFIFGYTNETYWFVTGASVPTTIMDIANGMFTVMILMVVVLSSMLIITNGIKKL